MSKPAGESSISSTLLERVQARRPEAWEQLVDLFGPVVYGWCRQSGLRPEDAADVVQEVFLAVAGAVRAFRRERPDDSFTAWLATITRNKVRDHFRRRQRRAEARGGTTAQRQMAEVRQPADPASSISHSPRTASWLSRRGLNLIRADFEIRTWEAFWRTAVDGRPPADVADELGMSVAAVYQAKSRVLRRLRHDFRDLL